MDPVRSKSETEKEREMVCSATARTAAEEKMNEIKALLEGISVQMEKYESLEMYHFGHVGDLGHIEELLGEAYEFIGR